MRLYQTLTHEMYRYVYGNFNTWEVPFAEKKEYRAVCGQNDSGICQILLYSEEEYMAALDGAPALFGAYPLPQVRVEVQNPTDSEGDTERQLSVSVRLVGLVRDDDGNYKSEMLLHETKKRVEKRMVQAVWLEVKTGRRTPAGIYDLPIRLWKSDLFGEEELCGELCFSLEVLPVTLPDLWEGHFYLDLWQHHTSIARTYGVGLWSEAHFALLDTYLGALEALGQRAITLILSEAPWSGQWSAYYRTNPSDYFEHNMVSVRKRKDGSWDYDFTAMNRYIELCMKHHIDREIELFGLLGVWTMEDAGYGGILEDSNAAVRVRYWDESDGRFHYFRKKEELEGYLRALDENLFLHGWDQISCIACDEPGDAARLQAMWEEIRPLTPHLKLKVTICSLDVVYADLEGVDDYVLNLPLILDAPERVRRIREQKKVRMSYYVAIDPPAPNTFLGCHPAEARFLPWLSRYAGLDGFLRWAAWLWPDRPFDPESYHYQKFRAGGTHFVYPGTDGTPVYSLRYENLKRGIRDLLIFQLYEEKTGDGEAVTAAIEDVLQVASLEEMQSRYRKRAEEILSLEQEVYEKNVNRLLRLAAGEAKRRHS